MEAVVLTKNKYQQWDDFCLQSDDAWFWHTAEWLEYNLEYRPDLKPRSSSFFVIDNKKILAICPLVIEESPEARTISYGGGFGPTPALANGLSNRMKEKTLKFIFAQIDEIAKKERSSVVKMKYSVLNRSNFLLSGQNNHLTRFGFLDASLNTQLIDLRETLEDLKAGMRHGHGSDVDRAGKVLIGAIYDKHNITPEIFDEYVELHYKAAGRKTRPQSTFEMMKNWISDGQAFLVGAKRDGKFIGFSYFFVYKDGAYYGSACNDPGAENLPIAHFIQWQAIQYLKSHSYRFYEIGWQYYGQTLAHAATEKEVEIARFKRGFGGITLPLFMGEKFYDPEYFKNTYDQRIKRYAKLINYDDEKRS